MDKEEIEKLKAALITLRDYKGVRLYEIEETLGMPKNCLSGMINGSRPFSPKWQLLLAAYVEAKNKGEKTMVFEIPTSKMPPKPPVKEVAKAEIKPVSKSIPVHSSTPPPGLSRTQQIRWYRENNQTLK